MKQKIIFILPKQEDFILYKKTQVFLTFQKKYKTEISILSNLLTTEELTVPMPAAFKIISYLNSILCSPIFILHLVYLLKKVILHQVSFLKNRHLRIKKTSKWINKIKRNKEKIKAVILVSNYYSWPEQKIICELNKIGIKTVLLENGWDRLLSKIPFFFIPKVVGSFCDSTSKRLRRLAFFRPERIFTVGSPHLDCLKKKFRAPYKNDKFGFFGMTKPCAEVPWLKALLQASDKINMKVYYRPHPSRRKRSSDREWNDVNNSKLEIDFQTKVNFGRKDVISNVEFKKTDATTRLSKIKALFCFWSTTTLDAILLGIPVIWLKPDLEKLKVWEFFHQNLPYFNLFKQKNLVAFLWNKKNLNAEFLKMIKKIPIFELKRRRKILLQELNLLSTSFAKNVARLVN